MKIFMTVLVIMIGMMGEVLSQNCAPNGITTNPQEPVNEDRPERVNPFDFTAEEFDIKLLSEEYNLERVRSPFYSTDNSAINHLYDPLDGIKDNDPIQGWELIKMDFGLGDDGILDPGGNDPGTTNPYMILYNKYTGLLRVFVMRADNQQYNGANITIKFIDNSPMQTSLLDHNAELKAIAGPFNKDPQLSSVAEFLTAPLKWFYADFPMIYDPCTCLFESKLEIIIKLTNVSEINATITSTGDIVNQGKPTTEQKENGSFSIGKLKDKGVAKTKQAIQVYKNTNLYKDHIKKWLSNTPKTKSNGQTEPSDADKWQTFIDNLKKNDFLRLGLKSIPYLDDAINIVDFFTGGGKKGPQKVEITPMSINLKSSFKGEIKGTYDYTNITYRTPGSKIPTTVPNSEYPYYNEVLGIFNLLQMPKISLKQYIKDNSWAGGGAGGGSGSGYTLQSFFQLEEDLQYVINPAAGLEIEEIHMAILGNDNFLGLNDKQYGDDEPITFAGRSDFRKRNEYRSEYKSFDCYTQSVFKLEQPTFSNSNTNYDYLNASDIRIKLMINLKRTDNQPDAQNVLFVATYPVELNPTYGITQNEAYVLDNYSYGFASCPGWDLPEPVDQDAIENFCNSSKYQVDERGFPLRVYNDKVKVLQEEEQAILNKKTSLRMNLLEGGIKIYPNPSSSYINISYTIENPGPLNIYIVDIHGKVVLNVDKHEHHNKGNVSTHFDTSILSPGMYFCIIETELGPRSKKFTVKR